MSVDRHHSYVPLLQQEQDEQDISCSTAAHTPGVAPAEQPRDATSKCSPVSLGVAAEKLSSSSRPTAVRDVKMLLRVFFVQGLFVGGRWRFPLLLALTAGGYEAVATTVLDVVGDFYMAISSLDAQLFVQVHTAVNSPVEIATMIAEHAQVVQSNLQQNKTCFVLSYCFRYSWESVAVPSSLPPPIVG